MCIDESSVVIILILQDLPGPRVVHVSNRDVFQQERSIAVDKWLQVVQFLCIRESVISFDQGLEGVPETLLFGHLVFKDGNRNSW